jgi:hypothetical protein
MVAGGVKEIAMNLRIYKSILWTVIFALLCGAAAAMGLRWAIFWVPGLVLMWYGMLSADRAGKIAVQNRTRSNLD